MICSYTELLLPNHCATTTGQLCNPDVLHSRGVSGPLGRMEVSRYLVEMFLLDGCSTSCSN